MNGVVTFDLRKIKARDISLFTRALKEEGSDAIELYAGILAKVVKEAPIPGDLNDPQTYLDLPYLPDVDDPESPISYTEMSEALNTALEKAQKSTKNR